MLLLVHQAPAAAEAGVAIAGCALAWEGLDYKAAAFLRCACPWSQVLE